jgi:hypothetical protein
MWSVHKPETSLWEWAEVLGLNPFLLAQTGTPSELLANSFGACETVFFQTASQRSDHLSRDDVALALLKAESLIARYTRTYPAPRAFRENILYPRPANYSYAQLFRGSSQRLKPIELQYGEVNALGVYEETLIDDNVAVTLSDPFTDGFSTRFSATVTVPAGTLASELRFYYSASDRTTLTLEQARIYPLEISIIGTTATITGDVALIVKPSLYLKRVPQILNALNNTNYVTTIDVYRQSVDISQSGTLIWDNIPCDNPPCEYTTTSACFYLTDTRHGYLTPIPAAYDEDTEEFYRVYPTCKRFAPDRVVANYIAGVPRDDDGLVNVTWRQAVVYLSTALLPQTKTCGCEQADVILYYYRSLPTQGQGESLEASPDLLAQTSQAFGINNRGATQAYILLRENPYRTYRSVNW